MLSVHDGNTEHDLKAAPNTDKVDLRSQQLRVELACHRLRNLKHPHSNLHHVAQYAKQCVQAVREVRKQSEMIAASPEAVVF